MKGRYEDCGGTTSSKYISPSPFVQSVVDIVNVTVFHQEPTKISSQPTKKNPVQISYKLESENSGKIFTLHKL